MLDIQLHIYEREDIKKASMFQWRLFVIHKLFSTCMLGLYVHKYFQLYNGFLQSYQINNEIILHFINLWSKEVPVIISYPITVKKIDGYQGAMISPSSIIYIIKMYKQIIKKEMG